jgi:three-Cys-motif partner protein
MASTVPEIYEGREQALVKHALLKSYLEKLVLIIGMSAKQARKAEICFVDCFAGPWGSQDDSLDGTSISLSLKTLEDCKVKLASLNVDARMRALYIEKDPRAFHRLRLFLARQTSPSVERDSWNGDFVDLRPDILQWCGRDSFVFFFVDPKGWKDIVIENMRPLLTRPRSEFLINFAYNFINRTAAMKEWQDEMVRLLGGPVDLVGLTPAGRENALVSAYRQGLKGCVPVNGRGLRARTAYVSVLDPVRQRTKYHLIYLTSHPTGIVEFMESSEKVELLQARVRLAKQIDVREQQTGVGDLFGVENTADATDSRSNPPEVDQFWLRYLAGGERRIGNTELADILESTDWLPVELQLSLVRLVKAGKVRNLDADASKRRTKPLHYDGIGERLQLVTT